MKPVQVRIGQANFDLLARHLFPGDGDEHAAVLICGIAETESCTRLLVREVALAVDGVDFVFSDIAYKKLTSEFVAKWISTAADQELCYLAVHNHGGSDRVDFSPDDIASHERGYPALLDIAGLGPVGALVFARNAVAGDIWFSDGRRTIEKLTIIGPHIRDLYPAPPATKSPRDKATYDRSIRLFGSEGQAILQRLKVGIIGVGGGGSLANEFLARAGIGSIIAVDPDIIEKSNIPRVVDSCVQDVRRKLPKVKIAQRVARRANPQIHFVPIQDNVCDEAVARRLADCDALILAGDNFSSRNVFNALCHQYLIPGFHVGVGILADPSSQIITDIKAETRIILPQAGGGCLRCEGLIPPAKLQLEGLTKEERVKQGYFGADSVEDVPEPSLMALNVLSVGPAVNDILLMFTGLLEEGVEMLSLRSSPLERRYFRVAHSVPTPCRYCAVMKNSLYAKGDRGHLPCRASEQGTQSSRFNLLRWVKELFNLSRRATM